MPQLTPHLWFDQEAVEAAEFYVSTFPDSRVANVTVLHDTPSGDAATVSFELCGQPFMAISAGPLSPSTRPCRLPSRAPRSRRWTRCGTGWPRAARP